MADSNEWSMRVLAPMNRVYKQPGGYLEGCVITDRGIVYVYSQGGEMDGVKETPMTQMQIVIGGRLYSRSIARRYTSRGIVTVANRFAQEADQTSAASAPLPQAQPAACLCGQPISDECRANGCRWDKESQHG